VEGLTNIQLKLLSL